MLRLSRDLLSELRVWWSLLWPSVLTNWSRMGMDLTDLSVLGHYKKGEYLSDVAYSQIVIGIVLVFVVRGMAGGVVNVLCSTAYGAGNFRLMGLWLQLSVLCSTLLALVLGSVWFFGGNLLQALVSPGNIGQKDAKDIDGFLRISLLWVLPLTWTSVISNFLLAQKIALPQMFIMASAFLLNLGANYGMIYGLGIGYYGSPLSTTFSRWFVLAAIVSWLSCSGLVCRRGTWAGWELRECMKTTRVQEFARQAIPSAVGAAVEEFQVQLVAVFAGRLGPDAVTTHNCTMSFFLVLSCAMWAIQSSTSARLGHHLGNGDLQGVWRVLKVSVTATFIWGFLVALVFLIARKEIGSVYSSKLEVQQLAAEVAMVVGIGYLVLCGFYVIVSVLSATGQPKWIAISFVIGGWGVAVPLAYWLAFVANPSLISWFPGRVVGDVGRQSGAGLLGLWLGLGVGYTVTMLVSLLAACRTDWKKIVQEALIRAEGHQSEALHDNWSPVAGVALVEAPP